MRKSIERGKKKEIINMRINRNKEGDEQKKTGRLSEKGIGRESLVQLPLALSETVNVLEPETVRLNVSGFEGS